MASEKRLIDANALTEKIDCPGEPLVYWYDIEAAPTVDAVEVVRCKDCKNWCYEYDDVGLCTTDVPDIDGVQRHADDFCSYGERRADHGKID